MEFLSADYRRFFFLSAKIGVICGQKDFLKLTKPFQPLITTFCMYGDVLAASSAP